MNTETLNRATRPTSAPSKVPIWEKYALTVEEAAAYFGVGANKIRQLSDQKDCAFVFWVGSKRMIKREAFEKFLSTAYSI